MQDWEADFCHDFALSCVADLLLQTLMAASRCIVWAELRRKINTRASGGLASQE